MQVLVRDNNVDQALKALKKKMQREGIFREMKLRNYYEKPSERRVREKAEAVRRARKLRREMSLPEVLLWLELRKRPGGFKFRKQQPAGMLSLDFACLSARLVIEVDGESHERGSAPAFDHDRDKWVSQQGYRTIRISASAVLSNMDGVVRHIVSVCSEPPLHQPSAGPPPRTGEDRNP